MPLYMRVLIIAGTLVLAICLVVFLQVKSVKFSYATQESCARQLTILPGYNKLSGSKASFDYKYRDVVGIGNFKIVSFRTCFIAKKAPVPGEKLLNLSPFGAWVGTKTYNLKVPNLPVITKDDSLSHPLATMKPLIIGLSKGDKVFDYQLGTNDKSVKCQSVGSGLSCDVEKLGLLNDKLYTIKISRSFNGSIVDTLITKTIKTINATNVVDSSVKQNQVVYNKPKEVTISFDKPVTGVETTLEEVSGDKRTKLKTGQLIKDKTVTLTLGSDLGRDKSYELTVSRLVAVDGSGLNTPYILKFKTSNGPGIASVSAGSIGSPLTQTIVVTFDQPLKSGQNVANYITTSGIQSSVWVEKDKLYVSYKNAPLCTSLNISIKPGLISNYDIVQDKAWSFTTRTICHTTSVIGYSRQGRPIIAYYFGGGSQTVLYIGSIHGNEYSTKYLMDAWIDELESNAGSIPAGRRIVVVPLLNPDGAANSSRYNAAGVDLNRNFPTADWQKDIYSTTNQPVPGGGGATPLSEPESVAIANLSSSLQPILTMSFHGAAGYAIANLATGSEALAAKYSQMTGYRNMTGVTGAFSYPITGTYDDWLREGYGLKSVLIELSSNTYSEFSRNKAALWAMAKV